MQLKLTERDVIMVARLHPADVVTCRVTPAAPRGFGHGTSLLPNTQNGGAPPPPFLSACLCHSQSSDGNSLARSLIFRQITSQRLPSWFLEPLAEIRKRRILCPLTETSGGVDVKSGAEQPDDAVGGECNDAEHQVAERLEVAANVEMGPPNSSLMRALARLRLGCPVKDAWPGRGRRMLADQDGLQPFFHQLLTGPCHRVDAGIERRRSLAVTPSFACFRGVGLQQDPRFGQQPGRVFACMVSARRAAPAHHR